MIFKNILVPYDDSKYARHAFKIAVDLAKNYNSKLTVITVVPSLYYPSGAYTNVRYKKTLLKKQRASTKSALSKIDSIAKKQGIDITIGVLEYNSVIKEIVSFTKSKKIDLIVMGTHGRTGWDRIILGSVANGVSQRVKCSVFLVR